MRVGLQRGCSRLLARCTSLRHRRVAATRPWQYKLVSHYVCLAGCTRESDVLRRRCRCTLGLQTCADADPKLRWPADMFQAKVFAGERNAKERHKIRQTEWSLHFSRKGDTFLFVGESGRTILGEHPQQGPQPAESAAESICRMAISTRLLPISLESVCRRQSMPAPPCAEEKKATAAPYSVHARGTAFLLEPLDSRSRSTALTRMSPFGSTAMPLAPNWSVRAAP